MEMISEFAQDGFSGHILYFGKVFAEKIKDHLAAWIVEKYIDCILNITYRKEQVDHEIVER